MDRPETQFAWNGAIALAYQELGSGETPLLYVAGYASNVELNWEHPAKARFVRRLASSTHLLMADPRGLGCSERLTPNDLVPLETMADDLVAVLDAAEVQRAVVLATYQMGVTACFLASTCPERVAGLILYGAEANYAWSEETPWQWTPEQYEEKARWFKTSWGTREGAADEVSRWEPSMTNDRTYIDWWYRYQLLSQAPGAACAGAVWYSRTDIRSILPSIHVPTLVLVRPEIGQGYPESAGLLADRIPGARLVELPGRDSSLWVGDQAPVVEAIERFLGAIRREASELERVLATVLFTDIVGSTEMLAELGNARWRDLVERHHAAVRALLERFRGHEVDTAGDGFYATFDGPARAIRCAQAIVDEVRPLGIEVRAGLHTGECELIDGKVGGMAVSIGARVGATARPSEVVVSQTVKDLVVGSGIEFEGRGEHVLKGVDGSWRLYRVVG